MVKKEQPKKQPLVSVSTFIILSLLVGIVIGFSIGSSSPLEDVHSTHETQEDNHDHSTHEHDIDMHSHETVEITTPMAPTLEIEVTLDEKLGYNLELKTTNFEFISPVNYVGTESGLFRGHAHLYINGEKITRLYSNSYYLGELDGHNEITVTLNSNNHEDYTINNESIKATQIIMSK
jgi:hypothetical protein